MLKLSGLLPGPPVTDQEYIRVDKATDSDGASDDDGPGCGAVHEWSWGFFAHQHRVSLGTLGPTSA